MEDNTIIPSYFTSETRGVTRANANLNSVALRVGEVRNIIYPKDKTSISGKWIEYSVEVAQQDGRGTVSSTLYHGCVVGRQFGGIADTINYTLRKDAQKSSDKPSGVGIGSKVLLLCINGNRANSVIIGGLPDNDKGKIDDKDDGHNLFFEFNGIQATVNKDGELTIMYRGATDNEGKLLNGSEDSDDQAAGAKIFMKKDGSIKFSTKDDKEYVNIDHNSGKVEVLASDNVTIKSTGTMIGDATDKMMLGSTYRSDETSMNNSLISGLTQLSSQLGVVGGALATAGSSMSVPIGGAIAAGPQIVAASQGLIQAVTTVTKMMQAITQFEGKASNHLSTKNKND